MLFIGLIYSILHAVVYALISQWLKKEGLTLSNPLPEDCYF